jgi:patatin-like phospholipase/acyl hydrolase
MNSAIIMTEPKTFKILSIDGGGIRGIFPAMFLANMEAALKQQGIERWQTYQNFDFICGTSTGGILALALSLGIPAADVCNLYLNNAGLIFGNKRKWFGRLFHSTHKKEALETLIRNKFREANGGTDPRLIDCKTNVAIPIYDLMQGHPSLLKSKYHPAFIRDYHIPAYQVALATAAAPTYFDPYSSIYEDLNGLQQTFSNKVDGGVFANNPTLNAIVEVQKAFQLQLKDLAVLSIGTGYQQFYDAGIIVHSKRKKRYGLIYWMIQNGKTRLIDLFMQGQSQQIQNLVSMLQKGIDKREPDNFIYTRIDTMMDETCIIAMDETNKDKLNKLAEKATIAFQNNGWAVINEYCLNFKS